MLCTILTLLVKPHHSYALLFHQHSSHINSSKTLRSVPTSYNGRGTLPTLRFDPHLESEIALWYVHAGLQSQLVPSARKINGFSPRGARILRRRGASALAGEPAIQRRQGALAPGQPGGTSPREDCFGFSDLHQLAFGSGPSQDRPAV